MNFKLDGPFRGFVFLFYCLVLLAFISLVFPEKGIQFRSYFHLKFPTIQMLVFGDSIVYANLFELDSLEVANNLALSKLKGRREQLDRIKQITRSANGAFHYPEENDTLLFPIFRSLLVANKDELVRIVHYGDSQIEIDRISGKIRERLQERFGGGGSGLHPPLQMIPSGTVHQESVGDFQRFAIWGFDSIKPGHSRYGPMLNFCKVSGPSGYIHFSPGYNRGKFDDQSKRIRIMVGYANEPVTFNVSINHQTQASVDLEAGEFYKVFEWNSTSAIRNASIQWESEGDFEFYAVSFDQKKGVVLDNLPMRGCSGTIFTSVHKSMLKWSHMELGTSWLWLQFGGNSMPVIKSQSDVDKYALSFRKQIRLFKEILPHVPVLVIGPSDMSKNIDGKWQTWPWLPEMVQALKNASLEEGAIYFNMFQAMGGKNAMPSWVNANPPLAGADYIHFTSKGAEKMAQIILETFFKELEIFELMQEHVEWEKENI